MQTRAGEGAGPHQPQEGGKHSTPGPHFRARQRWAAGSNGPGIQGAYEALLRCILIYFEQPWRQLAKMLLIRLVSFCNSFDSWLCHNTIFFNCRCCNWVTCCPYVALLCKNRVSAQLWPAQMFQYVFFLPWLFLRSLVFKLKALCVA